MAEKLLPKRVPGVVSGRRLAWQAPDFIVATMSASKADLQPRGNRSVLDRPTKLDRLRYDLNECQLIKDAELLRTFTFVKL